MRKLMADKGKEKKEQGRGKEKKGQGKNRKGGENSGARWEDEATKNERRSKNKGR